MFAEFTKTVHHAVYPPIDPKTTLAGSMKDKNIVITGNKSPMKLTIGAGRGIGRAIAQSFATAGAKSLFLISRTEDQLLQTKNLILAENPHCIIDYLAGSIVDESTVKQIFTKAAHLGPLDILVRFSMTMLTEGKLCRDLRTLCSSRRNRRKNMVVHNRNEPSWNIPYFNALHQRS
jgi:short chain dehydrogenase